MYPSDELSLDEQKAKWSSCTACDLGVRRNALNKRAVWGEGSTKGILFLGEGPGVNEEDIGRPFIGRSGAILRDVLQRLQFREYYLTNVVTCRACAPAIDKESGLPRMRVRDGIKQVVYQDQVPTPLQMQCCMNRLYQEIYSVDPVLIVTLGVTASEFLLKGSVSITRDRGQTKVASIPGVGHHASLTETKKVWTRKNKGVLTFPEEQNEVRYLVLPTLHPAYVCRQIGDQGEHSPWKQFTEDIKLAVKIYYRYQIDVLGVEPTEQASVDEIDLRQEIIYDETEVEYPG